MFATSANTSAASAAVEHFLLNNNINNNNVLNNNLVYLDNQVNNINNINLVYQNQLTCNDNFSNIPSKNCTNFTNMIRTIGSSTLPTNNLNPQLYSNINKININNNSNLNQNDLRNLGSNLINYQNAQNYTCASLQQQSNHLNQNFSQDFISNPQQLSNVQQNISLSQQLINGSQLPLQPKQLPQHNVSNIFCGMKSQVTSPQSQKYQQIQPQINAQNSAYQFSKTDHSPQVSIQMNSNHQLIQQQHLQQMQQIYLQLNNQNNPNVINRNLITNNTTNNHNQNPATSTSTQSNSNISTRNYVNMNNNSETHSYTILSCHGTLPTPTHRNCDYKNHVPSYLFLPKPCEDENVIIIGELKNFKILKQIGSGQFSVVYRAVYIPTGLLVALKCIRIFELNDMKTRLDCINEISLLQRLDNPNIIKYYTSFVESNELYIVLELADCGDLAQLLKYFRKIGRSIPERTIWLYFRQIANGLLHMHENCILHRDIKPPNVFITNKGVIKLGDLGLSKYYGDSCKGDCCCNNGNGNCLSNKEKNNNMDTRAILENHFNNVLSQKNLKSNPDCSASLSDLVKACTQQARNNINNHKFQHFDCHRHLMHDEANSLIGTPYYMAPERIQEHCKYDSQSDIWSLGCILYEMAALQSPFYGEKLNLYSLCKKIVCCSYPSLEGQYSMIFRALVACCLNADPKQRPDIGLICEIARYCSELSSKELQFAHLYTPIYSALKVENLINSDNKLLHPKTNSPSLPQNKNNYNYCLNPLEIRSIKNFDNKLTNPLMNVLPNYMYVQDNPKPTYNNAANTHLINFNGNHNLINELNNYNDLQSIDSDNPDSLLRYWKFDSDIEKSFI